MHELSLCHAIAGVVTSHADRRDVRTIHLRIGALRQVVPDTLTFCWGIVAEQEGFDGAELAIDWIPASVRCAACGADSEITSRFSICCPHCRSPEVTVLTGEEFLITSLDVRRPAAHPTTPERG
ncbi:hydrogenase maturation nickel metallochaperone HypA [Gordonia sp. NPDC003424]